VELKEVGEDVELIEGSLPEDNLIWGEDVGVGLVVGGI
jgi:hypothetical protein